jgi:hypothetical protein
MCKAAVGGISSEEDSTRNVLGKSRFVFREDCIDTGIPASIIFLVTILAGLEQGRSVTVGEEIKNHWDIFDQSDLFEEKEFPTPRANRVRARSSLRYP